jgi:hypothetical protein
VPSLWLEEGDTEISADAEPQETKDGGRKTMDIHELQRQFASFRQAAKLPAGLTQVEVRVRDFSYHASIRVDAPSIKTVFNTSPCYVGAEFVKNVGEIITGQKKVRAQCGVLVWLMNYVMSSTPIMIHELKCTGARYFWSLREEMDSKRY